mgnify:FL=1
MKTKLLKLAKMILSIQEIESDKGTLIINEPLAVGVEVFTEVEGEVVPATDGEYIVDTNKVEIKDGKVESIEVVETEEVAEETTEEIVEEVVEEKLEEEPATEEPVEEPQTEPNEKDLRIEELEGLLKDRDAVIEELTAKIKELEEQVNKPVEEPVKMSAVVKQSTKGSDNPALKYFN